MLVEKKGCYAGTCRQLDFLDGARGNNPFHPYVSYLHVEREGETTIMVTTDGRRIHKIESDKLPAIFAPGEFKMLKCKEGWNLEPVKNTMAFPDWKKVIPKYTVEPVAIKDCYKKNRGKDLSQAIVKVFDTAKAVLDADYLLDVLSFDGPWAFTYASDTPEKNGIAFQNHEKYALVMPFARD